MNIDPKNGGTCVPPATGVPNFNTAQNMPNYKPMSVVEKPPVPFNATDTFFAVMAFVCGYLFVWLVYPFCAGLGTTIFTFLFYGISFAYIKKSGIKLSKSSYVVLIIALLSAINFSLFANHTIQFLNLLFLMTCTVYWVASAVSSRIVPAVGSYFIFDLLNQFFQVPFRNFGCALTVIRNSSAQNKKGKTILAVLFGLGVSLPLLTVVISLLIQADAAFEAMIQQTVSALGEHVVTFLFRLLPAFLTGCYLFGLLYGNIQKRFVHSFTTEKIDKTQQELHILPSLTIVTVLCLLCGVYLLFFAVQAQNLFSAFYNTCPDGVTYAEYARRGFFELCKISVINFSVLIVVSVFAARKDNHLSPAVRISTMILSIETLLLIGTAFRKMVMYINRYGLTQKRVYTSWFMLLLFVLFCIVLVAQFWHIPVEKCFVTAFILCFFLLCYVNIDGIIVNYNVQRYEAGTLNTLDIDSFYSMPYAAAPRAAELYASVKDKHLQLELKDFLESQHGWYGEEQPFQIMTVQQLLAEPYWMQETP